MEFAYGRDYGKQFSIRLRPSESILCKRSEKEFYFYDLQLSTNERTGTVVGGFPWIRWYQTFGVGYVPNTIEPNVFMAVALDLRDDDGK